MDGISLIQKIGGNTTPNDILEIENKVIKLVEERGVAPFPYKNIISFIVEYIKKETNLNKPTATVGEKKLYIPYEITSKIDFIDNLNIEVYVEYTTDEKKLSNSGGGVTHFSTRPKMVNGKLDNITIVIDCLSMYGYLLERTLYNSLYHEIHHAYEAYLDLKKNGYYKRWLNQVKKSNINVTDIFNNNEDNNLFNIILYRLFSETEFNALISGLYGDLRGFHSIRQNFQKDVKNTQAYYIYYLISQNYKALYAKINDSNISKVKNLLVDHGIILNPYNNSTASYVKELSRKTNYLLKDLIKGIGRAASLYYDNQEEKFPDKNIKIQN